MAFVWVQQWIALPVVLEEQMGDLPPGSVHQPVDIATAGLAHDEHQHSAFKSPSSGTPFHSQLSAIPQGQARPDIRSPGLATSPHYPLQEHGMSSLNMGAMAGALPEYASQDAGQSSAQAHQQAQRPLSGASTSALVYQLQQNLQMPGHASGSLQAQSPYNTGFAPGQYQPNFVSPQGAHTNYAHFHPSQQRMPAQNTMQTAYQNFHQPSPYVYYPPAFGGQGQFPQGFPPQAGQPQTMYGRRPSLTNTQMPMMGQSLDMSQHDSAYGQGGRLAPGAGHGEPAPIGFGAPGKWQKDYVHAGGYRHRTDGMFVGMHRPGPSSSIPRGPPRKPKQSGHALWVGNLPPGTTVVALKDHFSRDATKDIESLFLISKSNCAFVNYRTESSCTAAMHRFHDSRFNGVRLVCRLRRSSAAASGVPTGPSAMLGNQPSNTPPPKSPLEPDGEASQAEGADSPTRHSGEEHRPTTTASEKYFIVKSLTLQDLELSVRNGIWATQSHNEDVLNKAYQSAENVYLIFSANKSGEYFGYARMASPILEDATPLMGTAPKPDLTDTTDVPKSIPTPATEFAPRGRIIDDSARGTIFWEAELSEEEVEEREAAKEELQAEADASGVAQSWGKPFKIEWVSTNRLPFYRTRGLRNPWNANREVKIARDGTELETSVGERLVQMFHRLGPSSAAMPMSAPMMQSPLGAPQMRPF
ncbi:hypothetical protein K491DRAFT_704632 [Lophiostoma macrostomum CBS 122681]|uniref:YTH domain-containing protein n=1 Tax=Lophiostoma macrostomum CBS 122681 TaxID=1314788 RepID=A0A6A6T905_9PLEO|nr:hypothetical protein K491DRAFT_704632 [Lophiostoma macrostomum CBS 122681]